MKGIIKWVASSMGIVLLVGALGYAQEEPLPMFGIQATVGPAFGVGDSNIRNNAQVGSAVGGAAVVNATRHVGGYFAYDRLDLSRKIPAIAETLTGGLVLRAPELSFAGWTPYMMGGAGVGRQDESAALDKLAVKASLGVERFFTTNLAWESPSTTITLDKPQSQPTIRSTPSWVRRWSPVTTSVLESEVDKTLSSSSALEGLLKGGGEC